MNYETIIQILFVVAVVHAVACMVYCFYPGWGDMASDDSQFRRRRDILRRTKGVPHEGEASDEEPA